MTLLSFMPDWLTIIIGIIILFLIYIFLPPDFKSIVKSGLKRFGFYIVLGLLWLYFRKEWGFVYEDPNRWPANLYYATFFVLLILGIFFACKSYLYEHRYFTNQLIADNISGSCHRYQEIGNIGCDDSWVVFFVGGSGTSDERFVIPWPWAKKLIVVPKCACQFIGNQILIKSQLSKVDLIDLPEEVADFISKDTFAKWCKDDLYFGLWSIGIKSTDPKFTELESYMKKANDRINELKEMLKGKLRTTAGFISETTAMQDKLKGKDWRKKWSQGGEAQREE